MNVKHRLFLQWDMKWITPLRIMWQTCGHRLRLDVYKRQVTGSVSKKTDYLVNNDIESTSSKNQKAKGLGIPIISEDMFVERFGK